MLVEPLRKMTVGSLILSLTAGISLPAAASTVDVDCGKEESNEGIYRCLNDFAGTVLQEDSPAERLFKERLARVTGKYSMSQEAASSTPLAEAFSIVVDRQSSMSAGDRSQPCFDFEKMPAGSRSKEAAAVKQQISEAALFLADIHARALGKQVSLLFPIKEVSICSQKMNGGRASVFEQRSLLIGLGSSVQRSHELLQRWNSGDPVRSSDLSIWSGIPGIGKKLRQLYQKLIEQNPEAIVRDKLAEQWVVLNPVGNLRTTALYTLAEAVFSLSRRIQKPETDLSVGSKYYLMSDVMNGPGFSAADRDRLTAIKDDDRAMETLYASWRKKLFSVKNMLWVIENAIGDQMRRDSHLHLVLRRINGGVAVVNDKNITVRLESLMTHSLPVADFEENPLKDVNVEFSRNRTVRKKSGEVRTDETRVKINGVDPKKLHLNADEVNGGVVIDLIDDVTVTVQLPSVSAEAYRRIALSQALRELTPGEEPSPAVNSPK